MKDIDNLISFFIFEYTDLIITKNHKNFENAKEKLLKYASDFINALNDTDDERERSFDEINTVLKEFMYQLVNDNKERETETEEEEL